MTRAPSASVEVRARLSLGASSTAIYEMVARAMASRNAAGTLLDVGCGAGNLWPFVRHQFQRYIGADVVRYDGFTDQGEFIQLDLDREGVPLPDATADAVVAVETIEHLENPRAFVRELVRLAKPGGIVVITTPNQLSVLSKMTLLIGNEFNAFREGCYPVHLTALLEVDLRRIAAECGLREVGVDFSRLGRIVFTSCRFPRFVSGLLPRAFSDNILVLGRKSDG